MLKAGLEDGCEHPVIFVHRTLQQPLRELPTKVLYILELHINIHIFIDDGLHE